MKKCITVQELKKAAYEIRKNLIELAHIQSIHIGGDLSVADIMTVLWQYQMNYNPNNLIDEYRDRFILSKGHASAVTSFNQAAIGCFSKDDVIKEYATDNGRFSMHSCNLVNPYVEISTGSLGHGFPVACGIAAALKLKKNYKSRVYVVMGDGEQSEGSVWEAALNAAHYKLGNIIALVDNNGLEADGSLYDITALSDIAQKYRSFGWCVYECDGNSISELKNIFDNLPSVDSKKPVVVVCHTIKGKGVNFMENNPKWHAGKLDDEQYALAIDSIGKNYEIQF